MSNNKSYKKPMNFLVYEVCWPDGELEHFFAPEENVKENGGVAAFEAELRRTASWFYPIGQMTQFDHGNGLLEWPLKSLTVLVEAWKKLGSPKLMGNAGRLKFLIQ